MKCPLCKGTIKKIKERVDNRTKRKLRENHLIKCENNIYKNHKQSGCKFMMDLSPIPLNGYIFTKDEVVTMIEGGEINIEGVKATFDIDQKFNPYLVFPEMEDF